MPNDDLTMEWVSPGKVGFYESASLLDKLKILSSKIRMTFAMSDLIFGNVQNYMIYFKTYKKKIFIINTVKF